MKLFDKVLLGTAGLSIYGIAMLIFSAELNSEYYKEAEPKAKVQADNPDNDVVVYNKEIDDIIQAYYKNINANPDKLEEENRLIDENEKNVSSPTTQEKSPENAEIHEKNSRVKFTRYKVGEGDSLWRLSQKFNVPVYTIISSNPLKDREMIHPGEYLNIPDRSGITYTVKPGDALSKIAKKYNISVSKILEANRGQNQNLLPGQKLFLPAAKPVEEFKILTKNRFIWPISGRITSGYGMRKHPLNNTQHFHSGLDIGGYSGEKIRAAADGIVVFSGDGGTYGNMVILRHKDGYMSIYAHASRLTVSKGQFVKQGDIIAKVGSTGITTGPHLHFEVKKSNAGMNPLQALREKIKIKTPVNG